MKIINSRQKLTLRVMIVVVLVILVAGLDIQTQAQGHELQLVERVMIT